MQKVKPAEAARSLREFWSQEIIPRGVEHCPVAEEEARFLL